MGKVLIVKHKVYEWMIERVEEWGRKCETEKLQQSETSNNSKIINPQQASAGRSAVQYSFWGIRYKGSAGSQIQRKQATSNQQSATERWWRWLNRLTQNARR